MSKLHHSVCPTSETHVHVSKIIPRFAQDAHLCLSQNESHWRPGWADIQFIMTLTHIMSPSSQCHPENFFFHFSWLSLSESANCLECWLGVYGNRCFHMGSLVPMCRCQLQKARVGAAGCDLPPRGRSSFECISLLPWGQRIPNNDSVCGAMDTRFKGPETIFNNSDP